MFRLRDASLSPASIAERIDSITEETAPTEDISSDHEVMSENPVDPSSPHQLTSAPPMRCE